MKLHNLMPVIGLGLLILLIILAKPLIGLVSAMHADPNVVAIGLVVVVALVITLVVFRKPLFRMLQDGRARINAWEDGDEYVEGSETLLLPPGNSPVRLPDGLGIAQAEEPLAAYQDDETCLLLAPNCLFPVVTAFNPTVILEQPGRSARRSVATRLYIEQFGGCDIPQIILSLDPGYISVVPYLPNGWLAGSPQKVEERIGILEQYKAVVPDIGQHYVPITEQNARAFAKKVIEIHAQVLVDLSSYEYPAQAALVFARILAGIQESDEGCILVVMQADRWLPNNRWMGVPGHCPVNDPQMISKLRESIARLMNEEHLAVILSTETLLTMDLRVVRQCPLWVLNMEPEEEDKPFISYTTGIPPAGLDALGRLSIIADISTQSVMTLVLNQQRSPHTDFGRQQTSGLLSQFTGGDLDQEVYPPSGK